MANSFQLLPVEEQLETSTNLSTDTEVDIDGFELIETDETLDEADSTMNRSETLGVLEIYEGADFKGRKARRSFSEMKTYRIDVDRLGIRNDSLSSLKVKLRPGYLMAVSLYEHAGFTGHMATYVLDSYSINYIGDDRNDRTSSIRLRVYSNPH